jgi:hypothetical protein
MHYGQLLADFNKVTEVPVRLRLIVLAADDAYMRYIEQSGRSVLPLKAGETTLITSSTLGRLAEHHGRKPNPTAHGAISAPRSAGPVRYETAPCSPGK